MLFSWFHFYGLWWSFNHLYWGNTFHLFYPEPPPLPEAELHFQFMAQLWIFYYPGCSWPPSAIAQKAWYCTFGFKCKVLTSPFCIQTVHLELFPGREHQVLFLSYVNSLVLECQGQRLPSEVSVITKEVKGRCGMGWGGQWLECH